MKITVEKEQFQEILDGLNNALYSDEEWDPLKGLLFIECEEDQIIADVMECEEVSPRRWLIVFAPIGGKCPKYDTPISGALEEVPKPKPKTNTVAIRKFLHAMTMQNNGYYVDDQ
jgi:hypothetical protein